MAIFRVWVRLFSLVSRGFLGLCEEFQQVVRSVPGFSPLKAAQQLKDWWDPWLLKLMAVERDFLVCLRVFLW